VRLQRPNPEFFNLTALQVGKEMGKERYVEIKVFGQTYTVKTDEEEGYIQRVAQYVNEKMEEVLKKTRSVSTLNVAILTALNIADDLLREREKREALVKEVEIKSRNMVEKIEMKMGGKEAEEVSTVD
jgi:cell division protein ZapA